MIRRYERKKSNQTGKSIGSIIMGIAMVVYAVPKLPAFSLSAAGFFTLVWLLFALLVIGANLYYLIGVDRESRQETEIEEQQMLEQHHRRLLMRD
jgi:TRAP-type mannitol/chloroaromatic compound transport system permease small subunit